MDQPSRRMEFKVVLPAIAPGSASENEKDATE
jgi:hypothetical protein